MENQKPQIVTQTNQGNVRSVTQPFIIVGCLIEQDGKFLLIEQNGKWNQPAGWLELEESIINGAKREAEEETGIEVNIEKCIGIYTLIKHKNDKILHAVKHIFLAHPTGKKIEKSEELHSDWFTVEQIKSMEGKFWDPDIIQIAQDAISGEGISLEYFKKEIV